jgi:uncharacterized protein
MMHLGEYNTLTILRFTSVGAYLGDDDDNDVLLPTKYIPEGSEIDDKIDVFLYQDSEDRLIATRLKPLLELHQFGLLRVNQVSHFGAFLEWGIEKDVFVPFKEQKQKMEEGKSYIIFIYIDQETHRLVGSSRVKRYLEMEKMTVKEGEEVDLLICETTELGKNVIVNDTHSGLIYRNDVIRTLRYGERTSGFVTKVREDGKLDIALDQIGFQKMEPNCERLLQLLSDNQGVIKLTDKSDPDTIRELVGMSKKTFKNAVGMLYKQRLISIEDDRITIL